MKSPFKTPGKSTPAITPPLVQPPLTDKDEKMKLVSKIRPIIQGIKNAEMEEMLKTAAEKNKDFNTVKEIDNIVAPAAESASQPGESAGQASVNGTAKSAGQPPGESADQSPGQSPGQASVIGSSESAGRASVVGSDPPDKSAGQPPGESSGQASVIGSAESAESAGRASVVGSAESDESAESAESAGRASVVGSAESAGQPPGESDLEKLPLSPVESDESGIKEPKITPSANVENWTTYIYDRVFYGVLNILKPNPKNVTKEIDLSVQIKYDLRFFKEIIATLIKDTKKLKGKEEDITTEVQKVAVSIASYFKYMHKARETVCEKMAELVNAYDKRGNERIRTDIRYKMSLPPILNIVNQMMYAVKHIVDKRDKERKLEKLDKDIEKILNGEKSMTGFDDKKGVITKVSEALTMKTEYFVDKLFPQENPMKERYTSLEAESYGDRDSFFEIIYIKTSSLPVPHDEPSLKTFMELILCLYIRLEGKVPDVDLNNYGLLNFKSQEQELKEGEPENYPSLLLEVLEKFRNQK